MSKKERAVRQCKAIAFGNLVLLVAVLSLLHGYHHHAHRIPFPFLVGEVTIIVVLGFLSATAMVLDVLGTLTSFALFIVVLPIWVLGKIFSLLSPGSPAPELSHHEIEVPRGMVSPGPEADVERAGRVKGIRESVVSWIGRWESEHGDQNAGPWKSLRLPTYLAVAVNFVALGDLVLETGGGLESPFTPLLLAPAILGAAIVLHPSGRWALAFGAVTSGVITDFVSQHGERYRVVSDHGDLRVVFAHDLSSPWWGVYAIVPLTLVLCTFIVTAVASGDSRDAPPWLAKPARKVSSRINQLVVRWLPPSLRASVLRPKLLFQRAVLRAARIVPWLWGGDVERAWQVMQFTLFPLARLAAPRSRAYGANHLPATGPAILACTHSAAIDAFIIGSFSRRALWFFVKAEVADRPILGEVLGWTGGFSVRRGACLPTTFKNAREILEGGHVVGIFPEGTRGSGCAVSEAFERGAASLALRTNAPIIPCAIDSAGWSLRHRRKSCCVVFGPPMFFEPQSHSKSAAQRASASLRIELERLLHLAHEATTAGYPTSLSDGTSTSRRRFVARILRVRGPRRISGHLRFTQG